MEGDQILAGGWLRGGTYIVTGPPGTGKTTLANQFCFSVAERGHCALYVTLLAETYARRIGLKAIRGLEVIKFRGSNNIPGRHTFLINERGVSIYPRWEAVYRKTPEVIPDASVRLRFGVPSMDAMCQGGVVSYSSTLLLGSPGNGKTLLGLH